MCLKEMGPANQKMKTQVLTTASYAKKGETAQTPSGTLLCFYFGFLLLVNLWRKDLIERDFLSRHRFSIPPPHPPATSTSNTVSERLSGSQSA